MFPSWLNPKKTQPKTFKKDQIKHFVLESIINLPPQESEDEIYFGCGCFWGAEKCFWKLPGVKTTAVGYAGGSTENPTYREVCSGNTQHAEVVRVVWNKTQIDISDLLKMFWECHDPTQLNRQGNDTGTQYRSVIYTTREEHSKIASNSLDCYQKLLEINGFGQITTQIEERKLFYYAENYHQQYLAKPGNRPYCSAMPTNVSLGDFNGANYKLSTEVWDNFDWTVSHCVLRSSNSPINN
ncbi:MULTISPECIES: peptide-methionine (S)-S-oxide reductase MsrA [unclassified Prochlorococcus]|uniref:peptide-methionine (S)-S-oxide reductase MsrA n=1 Tax=unclassified Prochlorococcus TaxID=2627481 RepID=UPI0005337CA1|nr:MULTISPECIES: peptide-methionine (S)-S-oxide reductase MsrA [unclassified Prochlorococcus]KGG15053.1 Peptide methionine sulfoxide reductase MsrA [Prochlorococcus sp. MIT 0602]KGG17325.1 Peptide methionine sulfoxide reductase MsrA [Prochlorococcus sp. MIT 0603]